MKTALRWLRFSIVSMHIAFFKTWKKKIITLATLVFWAIMFSPIMSVGLFTMLLVHEYGHLLMMLVLRLRVSGGLFTPVGAVLFGADSKEPNGYEEFMVAVMGPVAGLVYTLTTATLYALTGNSIFSAFTYISAMLNLMNLVPIFPLDGGRILWTITSSIHKYLGILFLIAGTVASILLVVHFRIYILLVIAPLGLLEGTSRVFSEGRTWSGLKPSQIFAFFCYYGLLMIVYAGLIYYITMNASYADAAWLF